MSVIAAAVKHMLAAGMEHDAIVSAVRDMEEASTPKRTARQERNRRYYESKKASENRLNASEASKSPSPLFPPDKEIPPRPPKEINPPISPQPQNRAGSFFDAFWEKYPNKVGKAAARKSWDRAVRLAGVSEIMAGLERYCAKTDDRPWCNPATWLNQERWNDQPAQVHPRASPQSHGQRMSAGDAMRALKEKGYFNGHDQNTNERIADHDLRQLPKPSW